MLTLILLNRYSCANLILWAFLLWGWSETEVCKGLPTFPETPCLGCIHVGEHVAILVQAPAQALCPFAPSTLLVLCLECGGDTQSCRWQQSSPDSGNSTLAAPHPLPAPWPFRNARLFVILFVRNSWRVCSQFWLSVRNSVWGPFNGIQEEIHQFAGWDGEVKGHNNCEHKFCAP